jgi:hypothetical protein
MCHMPRACGIRHLPKIEIAPHVANHSERNPHSHCTRLHRGGCFRLNNGARTWSRCTCGTSPAGKSVSSGVGHHRMTGRHVSLPSMASRHRAESRLYARRFSFHRRRQSDPNQNTHCIVQSERKEFVILCLFPRPSKNASEYLGLHLRLPRLLEEG